MGNGDNFSTGKPCFTLPTAFKREEKIHGFKGCLTFQDVKGGHPLHT